jgi:hypothetical protein
MQPPAAPPPTAERTGQFRPLCPVIYLNSTELPEVVSPHRDLHRVLAEPGSPVHKHRVDDAAGHAAARTRRADADLLPRALPGHKSRSRCTVGLHTLDLIASDANQQSGTGAARSPRSQHGAGTRGIFSPGGQVTASRGGTDKERPGEFHGWRDSSFTTRILRAPQDKSTEPCKIHAIQIRGQFIVTLAPGSLRIWQLRLNDAGSSGLLFDIPPVSHLV